MAAIAPVNFPHAFRKIENWTKLGSSDNDFNRHLKLTVEPLMIMKKKSTRHPKNLNYLAKGYLVTVRNVIVIVNYLLQWSVIYIQISSSPNESSN